MTIEYPKNDDQFEETTISRVTNEQGGWFITIHKGWGLWVSNKTYKIAPRPNDLVRLYTKGLGFTVRGLFINGKEVFYTSESQRLTQQAIEKYGEDAKDWLTRWDSGKSVWSIEMSGIGPSYEQAIQIATTEVVRHLIEVDYDADSWYDKEKAKEDYEIISKISSTNKVIKHLRLSGAMFEAALQLATKIYRDGPIGVMSDKQNKDRLIQVDRKFPTCYGSVALV